MREDTCRSLLERPTPACVITVDADGRIVDLDSAAEGMFGRTRLQGIGGRMGDWVTDRELFLRYCEELLKSATGGPAHRRMRTAAIKPDGSQFPIELDLIAQAGMLVALVSDISYRLEADRLLKITEERYSKAFHSNPQPISISTALEARFIDVNESFVLTTGYSREELIGRTAIELNLWADPTQRRDLVRTLRTSRRLQGREIRLRTKWGECRNIHIFAEMSVIEGEPCLVIVFQDVTEQKQAEQLLRQREDRYRSIIDDMTDSFWETDLTGHFTFFNNQVMVETRRTREELLAIQPTTDRNYIDEESLARLRRAFWEVRNTGQPLRGAIHELIRSDGTKYTVESNISLIRDSEGNPTGYRGLSRDVTDRKRAEKEWLEAKEAAENANRSKSEFLANMSHEIRTPMNGIIGMTELVLGTPLSGEQRECVNAVQESANALLAIINDILDFSKIEAGKLDIDPIDFSLRDSIDDMLKTVAFRADQKGLELACDILPDVPDFLIGDLTRLRQIMLNLIGNAVKFTSTGEVIVRVGLEETFAEKALLHFTVMDTGIGIREEKCDAIFEAFSQADGSMTRHYGGTGLGLTISSKLVEMMGGRIWVDSKLGEGSSFHFTAAFGLQQSQSRSPLAFENRLLLRLPVLVVDDNQANRTILQTTLSRWLMSPTPAESGRQAINLLEQSAKGGRPYPLVLLDAQMPGMDGFAVAERIKSEPVLSGATIMMLSSAGRMEDAQRCRELGIAAYLTKPIKQSDLLKAIVRVMNAKPSEQIVAQSRSLPVEAPKAALHILLAEDNMVNQRLALRLLEKQGHSVVIAGDGRQALTALENDRFDVVLMDVQMPEMSGFEATAFIRENEKVTGGHLPIVAMTAHAMKGDRERCLEAGMDGYISKPITAKDLIQAIEAVKDLSNDNSVESHPVLKVG